MMARLYKTSAAGAELAPELLPELLADQLDIADNFWSRAKGLLGCKGLHENQALWIKPGNNIHTFFMKFAIDCIFIDSKMEIRNLAENVQPFRFAGPFWKAHSVIEARAGFIKLKKLKTGDQLYVVN